MTGCQNTITIICTILILTHNALFTDGFVIPPYHYSGYMGGNYFPCNWGYSYCSYTPDYHYNNGCGCDYDVAPCSPCGNGLPVIPQWPSLSYPGVPDVPVVQPVSGLTSFPGLPHVYGLKSVSAIANFPGLTSVPVLGSVSGSPSVSESASAHASLSVAADEKGPFGVSTTISTEPVDEYDYVIDNNGDVNGKVEDEDEEEEKEEEPTEEEGEEENPEEEEEYNGTDEYEE
jgi:Protein involved in vacuole import and degradation